MVEVAASYSSYEQGKPYAARLTGLDPRYGFAREFLAPTSRHSSRSGATGYKVYILDEPGIYEVQSSGRKGPERVYYRIGEDGSGTEISVTEARALLRQSA